MREEYMIERQGKRFVLYAGLLEEAHSRGLRSIETELLQVPSKENGEVAIVKAVIRTEEGRQRPRTRKEGASWQRPGSSSTPLRPSSLMSSKRGSAASRRWSESQ